jgi:hypothetical protein
MRNREYRQQESLRDALTPRLFIDRKTRQSKDWDWISRKPPAFCFRQMRGGQFRGCNSGEARYPSTLIGGYIGCAYVVAKLILPCIAREKAIEVDVAGVECRTVVTRLKPPDSDLHG